MASRFDIIDEEHCEPQMSEFATIDDAIDELRRFAAIPWDQAPNRAPCVSWRTCRRMWKLDEYGDSRADSKTIDQIWMEIPAAGVRWADGFGDGDAST